MALAVQNLLRYSVQNLRQQYQPTDATVTTRINQASFTQDSQQSRIETEVEPLQIQYDSSETWAALGMRGVGSYMDELAERGKQAAAAAATRMAREGAQMGDLASGITIADIIRQRYTQEQTRTGALTSIQLPLTRFTVSPAEVHTTFTPAQTQRNWDVAPAEQSYTRPDFALETVQHPRVDFEYLGDWDYVPDNYRPGYTGRA